MSNLQTLSGSNNFSFVTFQCNHVAEWDRTCLVVCLVLPTYRTTGIWSFPHLLRFAAIVVWTAFLTNLKRGQRVSEFLKIWSPFVFSALLNSVLLAVINLHQLSELTWSNFLLFLNIFQSCQGRLLFVLLMMFESKFVFFNIIIFK